MKNRRTIVWLLTAIALTALAHALLSYKGGVAAALLPRRTLLDQPALKVTHVTVARRGERPAELEQGTSWRLVAPYSAGVDETTVLKMLDLLKSGEIRSAYSEQELLRLGLVRETLGLEDPHVAVTVSGPGFGTRIAFGSCTPVGDEAYAAVDGEAAVYVVSSNLLAAVDLPPEGFRRRAIFPSGVETAQQLDVKQGTGSFMRFAREGELWSLVQPTNATASAAKVNALLKELSAAVAAGYVWPTGEADEPAAATAGLLAGYGLDPENAVTVTVKCFDGEDRQVSFGNEKDGLVCALVQNAEAIVRVDAKLKALATAGLADFLDTRLFPFEPETVTRISIEDAGAAYLLAKGTDGAWLMDSPVAAATDAASVEKVLRRLCALRSDVLAAQGLSVSLSSNAAPVTVARRALDGLRLEDLRSREVLKIDPAGVRRIVSTRAGRSTAVVFDRDRGVWNVESSDRDGTVSAETVRDLLAALDPLEATQTVKLKVSAADLRAYGLEHPARRLAIDFQKADAVRRNILIGDRAPGGGRFATPGASDAVFVLSDATVRRLSADLVTAEGE